MAFSWRYVALVWLPVFSVLVALCPNFWVVTWLGLGLLATYISDLTVTATENLTPRRAMKGVAGKAVFITGCDSGFGHQLALKLHDLGFKIYAGCLSPEGLGAGDLQLKCPNLKVVGVDVTKDKEVSESYRVIESDLGPDEDLWALVNNAGVADVTEIEWCPLHAYQTALDVNTLGPIRVTKTFLPLLRKSQGRIVIVASLAGRYTLPGFSAYSMSKHATVSFADALRLEMHKWNISVHTVEPTLYKTPISNEERIQKKLDQFWEECPHEIKESYGAEYLKDFKASLGNSLRRAKPVEKISEVIDDLVDAVAGQSPKSRYVPSVVTQVRAKILSTLPVDLRDSVFLKEQPRTPPAKMRDYLEKRRSFRLESPSKKDFLGGNKRVLSRFYSMPEFFRSSSSSSPSPDKPKDVFRFDEAEEIGSTADDPRS